MQHQRLGAPSEGGFSSSPGAHLLQRHLHQHQHQLSLPVIGPQPTGPFNGLAARYHVNAAHTGAQAAGPNPHRSHLQQIHHHHHNGSNTPQAATTDHYLHLQPSSQNLVHKLPPPQYNHLHHHHQQQQRLKQIASYAAQQVAAATGAAADCHLQHYASHHNLSNPQEPSTPTRGYHQHQLTDQLQAAISTPPVYTTKPAATLTPEAYSPELGDFSTTTLPANYQQQQTTAAVKMEIREELPAAALLTQQQQLPVAPRPRVSSVSTSSVTQGGHFGHLVGASAGCVSAPFMTRSTSFSAPRPASEDQQLQQQQHCGLQKVQLHHHQQQQQHQTQLQADQLHPGHIQQPYANTVAAKCGHAPSSISPGGDSTPTRSPTISPHSNYQPAAFNSGAGFAAGSVTGSSTMSPSDALNLGINLEQYISKRNERERSRVRNVNDAFDNLKNSLPLDIEKLTKRMSKVEILRTAIGYIRNLENILGYKQQHHQLASGHRMDEPSARAGADSQDGAKGQQRCSLSPSKPPTPSPANSPSNSCGSMSPGPTGERSCLAATRWCRYHYQAEAGGQQQRDSRQQAHAATNTNSNTHQPNTYLEQEAQEDGPFYYQDLMRDLESPAGQFNGQ